MNFNNDSDNDRIKGIKKSLFEEKIRDKCSKKELKKLKKKLLELEKEFNTHEKYNDRDDPDYYEIRDIEVLSGDVDEEDYFKPI